MQRPVLNKELRELLFSASNEGLLLLDGRGCCLEANRVAADCLGRGLTEALQDLPLESWPADSESETLLEALRQAFF